MKKINKMETVNIYEKVVSWFDSICKKEPSAKLSLGEILFEKNRFTQRKVEEYQEMVELEEIKGYPNDGSKELKK